MHHGRARLRIILGMSARSESYGEAIDHIPPGSMLVIPRASWDEYEQLLDDIRDRPGLRVTYDDGRLEIMSPSDEHEEYKDTIVAFARVLSEELGIALESRGSATRRRRSLRKGAEPDASFWVENAHRIIGKRAIDLESEPAPDIVVEIDVTNESLAKFSIYGAFGVPEIWRFDGVRAQMYQLVEATYTEVARSKFFPLLTCSMLQDLLELSKNEGQTRALEVLRDRLRR